MRTDLDLDARDMGGNTGGSESFLHFTEEDKVSEIDTSKSSVTASEVSADGDSYERGKTMSTILANKSLLTDFMMGKSTTSSRMMM